MISIVASSSSGGGTEKRACGASSAEKRWTTTSMGITRIWWKYSERTGGSLSRKHGGNILRAAPNRTGLFSSAPAIYSLGDEAELRWETRERWVPIILNGPCSSSASRIRGKAISCAASGDDTRRGGTALYKLHLKPAGRYSEDIDLCPDTRRAGRYDDGSAARNSRSLARQAAVETDRGARDLRLPVQL